MIATAQINDQTGHPGHHSVFDLYVVSGFSRTTTVRLKADSTYRRQTNSLFVC